MTLPWDQLTSLGAGGAVAVVILWLVFGFLDKRNSVVRGAIDRMQKSSDKALFILEQQTKILDDLTHVLTDTRDKVITIQSRCVDHKH
jgi:hypothetical protein